MSRIFGDNEPADNVIGEINQGIGHPKLKIQDQETSTSEEDILLEGLASGFLYAKDVRAG